MDGAERPQVEWRTSVAGGCCSDPRTAATPHYSTTARKMSVSGMKKQLHKASQVKSSLPNRGFIGVNNSCEIIPDGI